MNCCSSGTSGGGCCGSKPANLIQIKAPGPIHSLKQLVDQASNGHKDRENSSQHFYFAKAPKNGDG
ncbi:MAG: hypothetical protein C5B54_11880, partial [Acidobacteria bacterium]